MSDRQIIEAKLLKKEAELQGLEEKLRTGRIYVQALRDVLKALGGDDSPAVESGGDGTLRSGSTVARAREEILRAGGPVHIDRLLVALGKGTSKEAKASLTGSIAAYVRKGEIFTRPAPNTYGLIEMGHSAQAKPSASAPPKGFGRPIPPPVELESFDDDIPF